MSSYSRRPIDSKRRWHYYDLRIERAPAGSRLAGWLRDALCLTAVVCVAPQLSDWIVVFGRRPKTAHVSASTLRCEL